MKKMALLALVAVLALGLLAGCGGGAGGAAKTLTVNMGEGGAFKFNPDNLSVAKGDTVNVTIVNKDSAQAHTFLLPDFNVKSTQVAPGKTETLKFTASKTGNFSFYCDVPGHKDGGMTGKLEVK